MRELSVLLHHGPRDIGALKRSFWHPWIRRGRRLLRHRPPGARQASLPAPSGHEVAVLRGKLDGIASAATAGHYGDLLHGIRAPSCGHNGVTDRGSHDLLLHRADEALLLSSPAPRVYGLAELGRGDSVWSVGQPERCPFTIVGKIRPRNPGSAGNEVRSMLAASFTP